MAFRSSQKYLNTGPKKVKVDAFAMASPNVGDQAFYNDQAKIVNIRSISFAYDWVTQASRATTAIGYTGELIGVTLN